MGTGANNVVYALAVDQSNNLYAGGWLTQAGGVAVNYIAEWNGSSWSALGAGVTGVSGSTSVAALAVDASDNLFASGTFYSAGGVSATNIAEWNGSSWSALGSGVGYIGPYSSSTVDALAIDPAGNVYAGGIFTTAGGVAANQIAKWNGSAWSPLGSGLSAQVVALAADSSYHLYAGGLFFTAGQQASAYATEANLILTPVVSGIVYNPGSQAAVSFQGSPGGTYVVQSSPDLMNWVNISTNLCPTNGVWGITSPATVRKAFFRAFRP